MADQEKEGFDEWAIVELMGHRRIAGRVTEQEIAGKAFLRIEIPQNDGSDRTEFYNPGSLYGITPVDEALARVTARSIDREPVSSYSLKYLLEKNESPALTHADTDGDDESEPPF